MMTPVDRLKLARDDFVLHETLYNTLAQGHRFYVGVAVILGGWSMSIFPSGPPREVLAIVTFGAGLAFWILLLSAAYYLFMFGIGRPWTLPRTLDHYMRWEKTRVNALEEGNFELGGKKAGEFAEEEMLEMMIIAFADASDVNRLGNLKRQRHLTWSSRLILVSVVILGLQGACHILSSYAEGSGRQPQAPTTSKA